MSGTADCRLPTADQLLTAERGRKALPNGRTFAEAMRDDLPSEDEDAETAGDLGDFGAAPDAALDRRLERQGAAALAELGDGWAAEAMGGQPRLAAWKVREDYAFDGSLAQRAAEEGDPAFAGFPEDPEAAAAAAPEPGPAAAAAGGARAGGGRPLTSTLVGPSDSDDDSDDGGLFSVVDRAGALKPLPPAARNIFDDDL
jgi:hypothetical protein